MALADGQAVTRLPAQDLDRARRFYAEKLGLEPSEERPGGLLYRCGGTAFVLFASSGASDGTFTQMGWSVDDLAATMAEMRARGVTFEEFDLPGLPMVDGVVEVAGNYPSKGGGASSAPGFATARATCSASASRSDRALNRPRAGDAASKAGVGRRCRSATVNLCSLCSGKRRPDGLRAPALVCAFKGWNDAGDAASAALTFVGEPRRPSASPSSTPRSSSTSRRRGPRCARRGSLARGDLARDRGLRGPRPARAARPRPALRRRARYAGRPSAARSSSSPRRSACRWS